MCSKEDEGEACRSDGSSRDNGDSLLAEAIIYEVGEAIGHEYNSAIEEVL